MEISHLSPSNYLIKIFDWFGVRFLFASILTHTMTQITVFAVCLCYLQFLALADRQYQQQKWEHPISSGDMSKQTSCVIAILIIVASIQRSQAPPHLLCFLTWQLPDNVSHLVIHISVLTHRATAAFLPPHSLWWYPVSLLLFLLQCYHSAEMQTVCPQKAQKHDMFAHTTLCAFCLCCLCTGDTKSGSSFSCWIVCLWHSKIIV